MYRLKINVSNELSNTPNLLGNATNSDAWAGYSSLYIPVYGINFVLGLPINSYVLWLILMRKGSAVVSEFFSLNLTVNEMFICLRCLFYVLSFICSELIVLTLFMLGAFICGRPLFLCLICVERYVAVVHPVTFLKYKPLRYRLACSAVAWIVILGCCVLCMFLSSNIIAIFICVILPLWSVFLIVKLFCCLAVVRALKHPGPGQKGKERDEANQAKRKAVTIILIITVTTVIEYCPNLLSGLIYNAIPDNIFDILWCISCSISLFTGYVHAFFYICRAGCLTTMKQ